jgi:predicted naringenin-chalcone synthase
VKVIGAGFGRTGTMSLKIALEELGAGPCFHSLDATAALGLNPGTLAKGGTSLAIDRSPWAELTGSHGAIDWHETLAGWDSAVGWLSARYYREMLYAWPDALVLLTVRDPQQWYASCLNSLYATSSTGSPTSGRTPQQELEAIDRSIWEDIFEGRFAERDRALELYARHNQQVIEAVPSERLLVYDVAQGWAPLCAFLEVSAPTVPFPHVNTAQSFRARFRFRTTLRAGSTTSLTGASHAARRKVQSGPKQRPLSDTSPRIAGLAVADSEHVLTQTQVLSRLGLDGDEFAEGIFSRCGVKRRHLSLTSEFLADTLQGRGQRVEQELMDYSIQAVDQLGVDARDIGTVFTASLYSLGCPSLAHRLVEHYRMDPATDKYHISAVGCAGAVPLLRLASQALREHPGKHALVVAAESMSGILMSATPEDPRAKIVGSAIFGDGCAAALLTEDTNLGGPVIIASQVHQIAGTLEAVSLQTSVHDSYLHLARELPDLAAAGLGGLLARFLADNDIERSAIDHWIVHPGGRRIIESVQDALELSREDLAVSWDSLAEHGNIGTPSIFYVLNSTLAQRSPRAGQHGLMVTIGPGVTVGLMLLRF